MPLLIQRQLFAQKENFCRECRTGAQAEEQKAPYITRQREEQACKRREAAEPPGVSGHRYGIPQRQKVVVPGYYPYSDTYT